MEISPSPQITPTSSAGIQPADSGGLSSDFETFLKMLTVQMKNQDPLDPIKSEDFAVQLATFSGVEQQVKTNDLLKSLTGQMNLMGMSQLAGWVGMEARAPVAGYFDGQPITLAPRPPQVADRAELVISDANGVVVQRAQIPVSSNPIEWTGMLDSGLAPIGMYSFSLESFAGGAAISVDQVDVYTRIIEASVEDGQTILVTEGGAEVPATSVAGLRGAGTAP